jgi:hypothetical protein
MRGAEYSKKTPNIFLNLPFLEAYLQKAYLQAEGKALMPKAGNGSATERKQL